MEYIASYYGLFAMMGGSTATLMTESIVITAFVFVSILGFKLSLWLVVGALLAHGILDFIHAHVIPNPGVPASSLPAAFARPIGGRPIERRHREIWVA